MDGSERRTVLESPRPSRSCPDRGCHIKFASQERIGPMYICMQGNDCLKRLPALAGMCFIGIYMFIKFLGLRNYFF